MEYNDAKHLTFTSMNPSNPKRNPWNFGNEVKNQHLGCLKWHSLLKEFIAIFEKDVVIKKQYLLDICNFIRILTKRAKMKKERNHGI